MTLWTWTVGHWFKSFWLISALKGYSPILSVLIHESGKLCEKNRTKDPHRKDSWAECHATFLVCKPIFLEHMCYCQIRIARVSCRFCWPLATFSHYEMSNFEPIYNTVSWIFKHLFTVSEARLALQESFGAFLTYCDSNLSNVQRIFNAFIKIKITSVLSKDSYRAKKGSNFYQKQIFIHSKMSQLPTQVLNKDEAKHVNLRNSSLPCS